MSCLQNLQHGLVTGKSCQSNLNNFDIDLVYLDFATTSDSVPKRKLLHKLEKYIKLD